MIIQDIFIWELGGFIPFWIPKLLGGLFFPGIRIWEFKIF